MEPPHDASSLRSDSEILALSSHTDPFIPSISHLQPLVPVTTLNNTLHNRISIIPALNLRNLPLHLPPLSIHMPASPSTLR